MDAVPATDRLDVAVVARDVERMDDRLFGPDVEAALFAFGVGIFCRGEAASWHAEVREHVPNGLGRDLSPPRIPGGQEGVEIQAGERGLVVEHLLEVRDRPGAVVVVPRKAAAEMVVD